VLVLRTAASVLLGGVVVLHLVWESVGPALGQSGGFALLCAAGVSCSRLCLVVQEIVVSLRKRFPACLMFGIILCHFLYVKKKVLVSASFKQN